MKLDERECNDIVVKCWEFTITSAGYLEQPKTPRPANYFIPPRLVLIPAKRSKISLLYTLKFEEIVNF